MGRLIHLLGLICILIFSSCSFRKHYKYTSIDSEKIDNFLNYTNNIEPLFTGFTLDSQYAVPDIKWVKKEFEPNFNKFLFKYNLSYLYENENDCEDLVQYGMVSARILYHNDNNKLKNHALAVGKFEYLPDIIGHSLLMFLVNDDGKLKLLFYETLNFQIVELNSEDLETCVRWEF